MTYCVGLLLDAGCVLLADTRTNAGLDNIATYRKLHLFETPGVTLFMTLPGPVSALDAWDAMLATGQRLAELLDADLMDDNQCLLTRQRIAQIREEMREFDRKAGLAGPKP